MLPFLTVKKKKKLLCLENQDGALVLFLIIPENSSTQSINWSPANVIPVGELLQINKLFHVLEKPIDYWILLY